MARRSRKTSAHKAASPGCQQPSNGQPDTMKPLEVEKLPVFQRAQLPEGPAHKGNIGREESKYPEALRERAISALLELERMAYKNFEEAVALATAAAQATDAVLNAAALEATPCKGVSPPGPPVVEELSSSSEGSGDFEGFLKELLRLLSLDLSFPSGRDTSHQQEKVHQQQALQRLDLLQRLASTEPKELKEVLVMKGKDVNGAQCPSLLERMSSGADSENLHLSLLEKLSFTDKPAKAVESLEKPEKAKPNRCPKRSIREQLEQQEEASENLHLSLLERIGSLADLPAGTGGSNESLHLSLLFGRLSQEDVGCSDSSVSREQKTKTNRSPATVNATACHVSGENLRGTSKESPMSTARKPGGTSGGLEARRLYTARDSESLDSSSSCSGSSESCGKPSVSSKCTDRGTKQLKGTGKHSPKRPRGKAAPPACFKSIVENSAVSSATQATVLGQKHQEQQLALVPCIHKSVLRTASPMPGLQRPPVSPHPPRPLIAAAADAGSSLSITGAAQLAAPTAAARDRRPASASPGIPTTPESFWDMFYTRTSRKMLENRPFAEPAAPASGPGPAAASAAPRSASPSSRPLTAIQGTAQEGIRQQQKALWVVLDSDSSLDSPCPGGCGSRCDERPLDADISDISSRDSLDLGQSPLVLRGTALQQQRQPPTMLRVAGPAEANGRLPILLEGPASDLPTSHPQASSHTASNTTTEPQHQQSQQPRPTSSGSPPPVTTFPNTPRRKRRGNRRRCSARQRR